MGVFLGVLTARFVGVVFIAARGLAEINCSDDWVAVFFGVFLALTCF